MYPYFSGRRSCLKPVCVRESSPILNTADIKMTELIKTAIDGEAEDAVFYERLTEHMYNADKKIIEGIMLDEIKHRRLLEYIYSLLTGETAEESQTENVTLTDNTADNISDAVLDETSAVKFYRELMLSSASDKIRDLFFEIMTDEGNHAALLNLLFTKYS